MTHQEGLGYYLETDWVQNETVHQPDPFCHLQVGRNKLFPTNGSEKVRPKLRLDYTKD